MNLLPPGPNQERVAGTVVLVVAVLVAALIFLLRSGPLAPPLPTPTPVPTPVPTVTPVPPTATAIPAPTAPPVPTPAPGLAGRVVCIDPGHGGADMGNVRIENGQIVLMEKDFTLAHSLELAERLRAAGLTVVLTRDSDTEANPTNADVNNDGTVAPAGGEARSNETDDLQARINVCNDAGADILVSVHYNGAENEFLEGYEVWYNGDRPFSAESARLANLMHTALAEQYAAAGYDAFDKGVGVADFAVIGPDRPGRLTASQMPGMIVEGLFLSNADDAAFIQTEAAAPALVNAYEAAILQYFATPAP